MILSWEMCQQTVKGWRVVGFFMLIARIVVPTIIIMTGLVSVYNAVFKGTADETVKSWKQIAIKIAAAVIIFYVPYLMSSAVNLFTNAKEDDDVYI